MEALAARVRAGDARAVARAISVVEDEPDAGAGLVAALHPAGGRAYVVGVTGAPGAGKSTLVDRLAALVRAGGRRVGIVAVDPTSPFTGGAILGDRVRMQAHASDAGVYVRSMATRGHLGGLARATGDAIVVLDAAGFDVVIVETVGVGQAEVDVVRTADVSVLVLVPGAGDDVQALKAGVMEIADVFVINKADREGADRAASAVESVLALEEAVTRRWRPPIVRTVATSGDGVDALLDEIERFRRNAGDEGRARRRQRSDARLREALSACFAARVTSAVPAREWDELVRLIDAHDLDPYTAAGRVVARVVGTPTADVPGRSRS